MAVRKLGRLPIGALALIALLGGCSSGSVSSLPATSGSMARAELSSALHKNKTGGGVIYLTQMYGNDVSVYQRQGQSGLNLGFLHNVNGLSEPQGAMTTQNGWLYVADEGGNNVLIYRAKKTKLKGPTSSLTDYNELPVNVALTPDRNLVAVSNKSTTSGATGSVSVYVNRQVTPNRVLTYGSASVEGMGVAVDRQGNCYWSFNAASGGSVVEFTGCNEPGTLLVSGLQLAGGLALDQSGNLYYIDTELKTIYRCQKTSKCEAYVVGGSSGSQPDIEEPLNMNFDYHGKDLWVADLDGYVCGIPVTPGKGHGDAKKPPPPITCTLSVGGSSSPPFGVAPEPL
jgi:DNA-binding beta-propeller fold protein YncE